MAAIIDIGPINAFNRISAQAHGWERRANMDLIKMAIGMSPGVVSKTAVLPDPDNGDPVPDEGTLYISPMDGRFCVWINAFDDGSPAGAGWYASSPTDGVFAYVMDENSLYVWLREINDWSLLINFNEAHMPVQREFSFFAPGLVRPNAVMFAYTAGMEFTIEAGAPNSGAGCQVAPSADVTFSIRKGGGQVGTIFFEAGETTGTVSVPSETIIQPALPGESLYVRANLMTIVSPVSVAGMQGLDVTLRGKIRGID